MLDIKVACVGDREDRGRSKASAGVRKAAVLRRRSLNQQQVAGIPDELKGEEGRTGEGGKEGKGPGRRVSEGGGVRFHRCQH